jgi:hypothetical protein
MVRQSYEFQQSPFYEKKKKKKKKLFQKMRCLSRKLIGK